MQPQAFEMTQCVYLNTLYSVTQLTEYLKPQNSNKQTWSHALPRT